MGRSQRHMVETQGNAATGSAVNQGVVAPGLLLQATDAPASADPLEVLRGIENVEVPIGEPGGPLAGSSLTGPVPSDIDTGGTDPGPEPDPTIRILGFEPNDIPAGYPDLNVDVLGEGFEDGAVVIFGGAMQATEFVSENRLRFLCDVSGATAGDVPVTVRNPAGAESEAATFTFAEPAADDENTTKSKPRSRKRK